MERNFFFRRIEKKREEKEQKYCLCEYVFSVFRGRELRNIILYKFRSKPRESLKKNLTLS